MLKAHAMQSRPKTLRLTRPVYASATPNPDFPSSNHRAQFIPACDSRNRRIPGLYLRGSRYYAQLWVDLGNGRKAARRFPLKDGDNLPVRTLREAQEALEIKRHERRENKLRPIGPEPLFANYYVTYFEKATVQRKRTGTIANERQAVARWSDHLGHVRIDQIATPAIAAYVDKRLKGGVFCGRKLKRVSERTANLDLIVLRNVLKAAVDDGLLRELPRIKMLDEPPSPKRKLITPDEFNALLTVGCSACKKNGEQLADYLRFLAFSGAREKEALRIRWQDIDFELEKLTVGSDGLAKNRESRTIELNPQLRTLLRDMSRRRPPDCSWLFASPQRGPRDEHAKSFRESLKIARTAAQLEWVAFHDLRHYFCSVCVMAGINFMVVATWLGHKDGGILVGKVYGHLLDEHRQKAAKLVRFPTPRTPRR
jgi:integrase